MKKPKPGARATDEKFRSIFEYSAVSLWEGDISKLRAKLSALKKDTGMRMRDYLAAHPGFAPEAARLVEVTDVNQAGLRLFEAEGKEQLLGPLDALLDPTSLSETLLAIDDGRSNVEAETTARTLKGKALSLLVKSHIPQADAPYPSMVVSLIDITARKQEEERARQSATIFHSIIESIPDMIFVKDASLRMVLCNSALAHATGREPQDTYGKTDIENGWSPDLVKGNPEKGIVGWEKDDLAVLSGKTIRAAAEPSEINRDSRIFDTLKFPLRDAGGAVVGLIAIARDVTEQRRNEAALRASEASYRGLVQQAADGIIELDREGKFIGANAAFCEMLGCAREELDGISILDTYPDDSRDAGSRRMSSITAGQVMRFARPMKRKDGSLIQVEVSIRLTEKGTFVGILHDITKRTQYEAALAWERSLFDTMLENLPDRIYFKDLLSRFTRISRSQAFGLGVSDPSQAIGRTDADFFSDAHARKAFEEEQRIIRTAQPVLNMEERLTFPDRPECWTITTKMPLRDSAGAIVGTFGISHDITRRKQLEEKNQQLATLVEFSDDAIVGMDLDRRITVWNKGAENVYGYSAAEMIGKETSSLIPPELEEEAQAIRDKISSGMQIAHFETTRLRKDGSRIIVSLSLSAVHDGTGRIIGLASVARDITAEKAFQVQQNRVQRLESLATLAGGVAHQFNNINTVVKGYLELVRADESLPAGLASYVDAADAGLQRAVDITDRLLTLTEPAGSSNTVRLDVLARTLLPFHEKRILEEGVLLDRSIVETPLVQGSEVRLKFVFSSLIVNALDSLLERPAKTLSVRTGRTHDSAYFEVEDSGCGIPQEDIPRIFSPFFSMKGEWAPHGSPQARVRGVGLSLAISSTTVSEYGGRIEVQSTAGVGSTFRVILPLAGHQGHL